eukprot:789457-Rhodomonas_salina.1
MAGSKNKLFLTRHLPGEVHVYQRHLSSTASSLQSLLQQTLKSENNPRLSSSRFWAVCIEVSIPEAFSGSSRLGSECRALGSTRLVLGGSAARWPLAIVFSSQNGSSYCPT